MAVKGMVFVIALLVPLAVEGMAFKFHGSSNFSSDVNAPKLTLTTFGATAKVVAEYGKAFARSDEDHIKSMEDISKDLTLPKAVQALQQSNPADAASLKKITSLITGSGNLRTQQNGFGGLDGARKLLNDMIHESMTKYDAEIAKCMDYYAKQCALMEVARGQISAANYIAASSRALILDAQYNINKCEVLIPETKQELKDHNLQCKTEVHKMNERLKAIQNDIASMTMILEMTDCDAKLLQMHKLVLLRCKDQCTHKDYVTFNHEDLQEHMNQLQTSEARDLVMEAFADFSDDDEDGLTESLDSVELVQVPGSKYQLVQMQDDAPPKKKPKAKKTKMGRPPVPRTKVPRNPCTDPNQGAPSAATKRAAKCTLKKSPRCYKLQGRFLQIQAGIADDRDQLMEDIQKKEDACEDTKKTLEAAIANDQALLQDSQTKLAAATEKESSAGENGRQVAKENEQYEADLKKQMGTCTTNYLNFETEICALKKIRGDLFKKFQKGHSGFFQDCEVSPWTPEACTKKCAGGDQKLSRNVLKHPDGGAKCLPLSAKKRCNLGPCPVDCVLHSWSGWSKCSAKCGGGVQQRVRDVKVAMKYNGRPCGDTTQTKACAVDACEKDCELDRWTKWTSCTKHCDGGTKKRVRMVKVPAQGSGKCADKWDPSRLQYEDCNVHRCKATPGEAMKCNKTMDVILLLDGTPKSGKKGWAAEVKAANFLVDAFGGNEGGKAITAKPSFSVIHYTGPKTWSGVSKCTGKSTKKVDMEKTCKIKIATHFTEDMKKVKGTINGLQYQAGSKLLSLALMTVQSELALGRKTARTIVVVFIDGEPLSYRKTLLTSRAIRKKARLVYVPVTKFSPLKSLKTWASRRWQENIVKVASFEEWKKPEVATHIIANICPREYPKLKVKMPKKGMLLG